MNMPIKIIKQSKYPVIDTLPIPSGWFCVAQSSELETETVKSLRYFDRELVLFRSQRGQANLLDAHCPHLGAHLGVGGEVVGNTIQCPFHAWRFNGDGVCEEIPYATALPPKAKQKACIRSYPVKEVNQQIWAWYHPLDNAPNYDIEEMSELSHPDWTDVTHYDWVIDTAIQEAAENAVDTAHFKYVHEMELVPAGEIIYEGVRRSTIVEGNMGDLPSNYYRLESINHGPGQNWNRFSGPVEVIMMATATPISEGSFHLRFSATHMKYPKDSEQTLMAKATIDEIVRQLEQDIPIWENKIYRPQPLLCNGDGPIAQFRKYYAQFYTD